MLKCAHSYWLTFTVLEASTDLGAGHHPTYPAMNPASYSRDWLLKICVQVQKQQKWFERNQTLFKTGLKVRCISGPQAW